MVSEDPETYDVHAKLFGGWPNIVSAVLQHVHALKYEPETFPSDLHTTVEAFLKQVVIQAGGDSKKPQSFRMGTGGAFPPFAFDAPVLSLPSVLL